MKKIIIFFILSLTVFLQTHGQGDCINMIITKTPFKKGIITRTLNFYQTNNDTLVEVISIIDFYDPNITDLQDSASDIPLEVFEMSEKNTIRNILIKNLNYAFKDIDCNYLYRIVFPDLFFKPSSDSIFELRVVCGNRVSNFIFSIVISPEELKKQLNRQLKP